MLLPNFLIIGVAKAGTTSLWRYLGQHPEVFLPPGRKEPNFFAFAGETPAFRGPADSKTIYRLLYRRSVTDLKSYGALFKPVSGQRAIGEASVRYLYFPKAAIRIKELIPSAKMVVMLRNPVDRLYSHYCMNVQHQLEPLPLAEALAQEEERRRDDWGWDWHYVRVGLYYEQIKRYLELFNREQIGIFLYEDFCRDSAGVFRDVCRHIGVDDAVVPDLTKRSKVPYRPRNLLLDRLLERPGTFRSVLRRALPSGAFDLLQEQMSRWNRAPVPPMSPDLREQLQARFRSDIDALQDLIERDLTEYL